MPWLAGACGGVAFDSHRDFPGRSGLIGRADFPTIGQPPARPIHSPRRMRAAAKMFIGGIWLALGAGGVSAGPVPVGFGAGDRAVGDCMHPPLVFLAPVGESQPRVVPPTTQPTLAHAAAGDAEPTPHAASTQRRGNFDADALFAATLVTGTASLRSGDPAGSPLDPGMTTVAVPLPPPIVGGVLLAAGVLSRAAFGQSRRRRRRATPLR